MKNITSVESSAGTGWAMIEVVNRRKGRTMVRGDQRMIKNAKYG